VDDKIGIVGSPSTTSSVTVDILEPATGAPLRGQLVYLKHSLKNKTLIALGTITEIKTVNRWHEDPNMRGVLKMHGSLPHLSGVGDVRTAEVLIQAAYLADDPDPAAGEPPIESAGSLSMSPTTGAAVSRVTGKFLESLLRRHANEITYLGWIYRSEVRLPLTIRHFGHSDQGGAGEAYHTGVFGMTGSGKSALASYLIAAQLRHPQMGVFVIDPQGQFTSEKGLPFSLQDWAESRGRTVQKFSITRDLRLKKDAPLLSELLGLTRFFRDMLTLKGEENRESAVAEFHRLLDGIRDWENRAADDVLRQVLTALLNDEQALNRIYASQQARARLASMLTSITTDTKQFRMALKIFLPVHSLFTARNPQGGNRTPISTVLENVFASSGGGRPLTIIDFSGAGYAEDLLGSSAVKARILRLVCGELNWRAERQYQQGSSLNVLVVFDEAHRFASQEPEDDESKALADKLVDYVRTTRKYGLGWMFITQEITSLRRGIFDQLRVRAFGYGLTSGTELSRLRETIGDPAAVELYRSFVDPAAVKPSEYPFMLSGPVSPLSFTGAPVFLSVYTNFDAFRAHNNFDNNFPARS
jgi:DNA helicase HerA-like ATPase